MQNQNVFTILNKLGQGTLSEVFTGYLTNQPDKILTIKVVLKSAVSENQKNYFRQKIEHLKVISDPQLNIPTSFVDLGNHFALTRVHSHGLPLDIWVQEQSKSMTLNQFFIFAVNTVELIQKIHTSGIIHGGIKPSNILINPQNLNVNIVDFITPFDVRNVSHFIYDRNFVEGTLAYTSPEQTGRINHRVEFTTDIYSLGIIFYELLTGILPFKTNDPLELIHSHLAEEASLVHELNREIPPSLSRIIEKMIFKQPEKRYQGGSGLIVDLLKVKNEMDKDNFNHYFRLGLEDRTHRITFISKMVGRDYESQQILTVFKNVSQGNFGSALISGFSGIGKTRLIQELQKPLVKNKGYFTSGKFDVYQKNIPYSSLIQAFRNLTRTFLTESDERVLNWKNKISKAIGQQGKVITDVIPEVELLIGPQPQVMPLPPVEARNRFLNVFGSFLSAIATQDSPLVLFIDDLQWCDLASFEFLQSIFENYKDHPYLMLLGAYRHNEVDTSHPLARLIKQIKNIKGPLIEIMLGPIQQKDTHEMVAYILDSPLGQTVSLAQFIGDLTEGNPLFVSESLSYLYNEKLLYFNDINGQWSWDMDKIRSSEMPSSVVGLFSSKVHKLPKPTIELLEYCACMGNLFTPDELSNIKNISLLSTFETLKPALSQGLLIENKDQLQFVHDKVQEATLSFIDIKKRFLIHKTIAMHLYHAVPPQIDFDKLENIFTMASHINITYRLLMDLKENLTDEFREIIIKINYHAGNSALNSLATEAANEYYRTSKDSLPLNAWTENYERTFRIFQKLAKTELMVGHYENSEKLLNQLLDFANSDLDKAEALAEQTTSLSSIGNFIKAIETANRGLAFFNKNIPMDSVIAKSQCEILMKEIHADPKEDVWTKILNMPFTKDRKSKIELSFYSELIPDLYMSGLVDQLYLAAAQSTQHCLAGGMDESVIYSFSIMGLNLGENLFFEQAFKYEDLAKELSEKYPNTFGSTRGMNGVVWCNMHSRSHPKKIVEYCLKSIQSGKNCGDLYNAGLSYGPLMWNLILEGRDLKEVELAARECFTFSQKFHLSFSVGLAEAVLYGWVEPMNNPSSDYDITEKILKWEKANHVASIGSYYVLMAISKFYFGLYEEAQTYFNTVCRYLHGLTDNVLKRKWYIFSMLNKIRLFESQGQTASSDSSVLDELISEMQPQLELVKKWVELGPLLKPYYLLLICEISRVKKGFKTTLSLYVDLILETEKQDYVMLLGYIHEILFIEYKKVHKDFSQMHLLESLKYYEKSNSVGKVQELKIKLAVDRTPFLKPQEFKLDLQRNTEYSKQNYIINSSSENLKLDLEYFIKSSNMIAAEIKTDALLKKIMNLLIEFTGAQYGCIVIQENEELYIVAESEIKNKSDISTKKYHLEESGFICKSLARFVFRTNEPILLKNALEEGLFINNQEVQQKKIKSFFGLPLNKQQKKLGLIYLENRLVPDVFRQQVTEMVSLLSSQIAISIENAKLIEEMNIAQNHIQEALKEKEVLLKEINHRVKNNLQVLSSIFNMKSRNTTSAEVLKLLKESQTRIRSLALVHEKLHYSNKLSSVDFANYLKFLIPQLCRAYSGDGFMTSVQLHFDLCECQIDIDKAMPLGLIVNELVSNSLKYAFPNDQAGTISVKLELQNKNFSSYSKNKFILTLSDDGIGFDVDEVKNNKVTIGLQLVTSLCEQIGANLSVTSNPGTKFSIEF